MSSEPRYEPNGTDAGRGDTRLFVDPEEILLAMQEIVGRKWHPVILYYLLTEGPMGFSALKDRVGDISSKMLSESLDALEDEGLVSRELLSDQPVRVEYAPTERGESLEPLIAEMVRWGDQHRDQLDLDGTDGSTASVGTGVWEGR